MLLQNIRNELWIQIIVVIAVFVIGIVLLKSYNKNILKLETSMNIEVSMKKKKNGTLLLIY